MINILALFDLLLWQTNEDYRVLTLIYNAKHFVTLGNFRPAENLLGLKAVLLDVQEFPEHRKVQGLAHVLGHADKLNLVLAI